MLGARRVRRQATQTTSSATSATTTTTASVRHGVVQTVGACVDTTITQVGTRLQGVTGSGSAVLYANGLSQVSYDAVPGIDHSKAGDAVHLCLVSLPPNCPPGDDRGKVYNATNQRTGETWSASDSEHMCGGA
jgi:hypothetical protein